MGSICAKLVANRIRPHWIWLSIILFMGGAPHSGFADETGQPHEHTKQDVHKANIEKMLEVIGVPSQVNQAAAGAIQLYSASVTDKEAGRLTKDLVAAYQKDLTAIVNSVLSWDALKPNYISTYAALMDETDVRQTLDFFESEIGQTYLRSQAQASSQIKVITTHLAEEDMAPLLIDLTKQLREGLTKVQSAKLNKAKQQ